MTRHPLSELKDSETGAAALEFALVAPVFLAMLMGMLNVGQMAYGTAVLNGAVQNAARSSTLEGADTSAADQSVSNAVSPVLPGVAVAGTRSSYFDFADIGRPESFDDEDDNGDCNDGESYVDENGSGNWDADIGVTGNGGAGDVVVYTVRATYSPLFSIPFAPDAWASTTLEATAVKKNQPFADQSEYTTTARTCT